MLLLFCRFDNNLRSSNVGVTLSPYKEVSASGAWSLSMYFYPLRCNPILQCQLKLISCGSGWPTSTCSMSNLKTIVIRKMKNWESKEDQIIAFECFRLCNEGKVCFLECLTWARAYQFYHPIFCRIYTGKQLTPSWQIRRLAIFSVSTGLSPVEVHQGSWSKGICRRSMTNVYGLSP